MSDKVSEQLNDATKDILSEESLNDIQSAFDDAVAQKVQLHVEKALLEQDNVHASKLAKLLEAIDTDHSKKLEALVEAIDNDHSGKLGAVVQRHQHAITEQASEFKSNLVENISNYLELYLEKAAPQDMLNIAVQNKRGIDFIAELRNLLAVDSALAKDSIKTAVRDGKDRLDEAAAAVATIKQENDELKKQISDLHTGITLEDKCKSLDPDKAAYVTNLLRDKDARFITENFDYTVAMFDKTEDQRLEEMKADAVLDSKTVNVDRPVLEESAPAQSHNQDDGPEHIGQIMNELGKY